MSSQPTGKPVYRETQRFTQWWLWLIVASLPLLMIYAMVQQYIFKVPFGTNPASDTVLAILGVVFGLGFPLLFLYLKLVVEVRHDGIYLRYYPLHFRFQRFRYSELKSYRARSYRAIREYGGWGIKYGKSGKAYNVKGDRGVQLVFTDGRRILIGSQEPEALCRAIESTSGRSPIETGPTA